MSANMPRKNKFCYCIQSCYTCELTGISSELILNSQILNANQRSKTGPRPFQNSALRAQESISTSELSESDDRQMCSSRGLQRSCPLTQASRLFQPWSEEHAMKRSILVWTTAEPLQRDSAQAPSRSAAGFWKPSCSKTHISGVGT